VLMTGMENIYSNKQSIPDGMIPFPPCPLLTYHLPVNSRVDAGLPRTKEGKIKSLNPKP